MYEDPAFYRNAFKYYGQNSFRDFCIEHLGQLIHPDYKECFPNEHLEQMWTAHTCNTAFDFFIEWLSEDPPMPANQYAELFANIMRNTSETHVCLIDRETPQIHNITKYKANEPSKK